MSWTEVFGALRKMVLLEDQVTRLNERVRDLSTQCDDMNQRLARLEGKFELLESIGSVARRRLPPGS